MQRLFCHPVASFGDVWWCGEWKENLQILELVFFNFWIGGVFDDFFFFVCAGGPIRIPCVKTNSKVISWPTGLFSSSPCFEVNLGHQHFFFFCRMYCFSRSWVNDLCFFETQHLFCIFLRFTWRTELQLLGYLTVIFKEISFVWESDIYYLFTIVWAFRV